MNYTKRTKLLWMEVDLKHCELPTGRMGDTAEELARACGTTANNIRSEICHARKSGHRCRYVVVRLGERRVHDKKRNHEGL